MEDLLWYVAAPLLELLGYIYTADNRRPARWITLGCAALVVGAVAAVGAYLLW
jgi:hypothetical protein